MMSSDFTFTGGNMYYITYRKGQFVVMENEFPYSDREDMISEVYRGHYEDCLKYIENCIEKNYEYDLYF